MGGSRSIFPVRVHFTQMVRTSQLPGASYQPPAISFQLSLFSALGPTASVRRQSMRATARPRRSWSPACSATSVGGHPRALARRLRASLGPQALSRAPELPSSRAPSPRAPEPPSSRVITTFGVTLEVGSWKLGIDRPHARKLRPNHSHASRCMSRLNSCGASNRRQRCRSGTPALA